MINGLKRMTRSAVNDTKTVETKKLIQDPKLNGKKILKN